MAKKRKQGRPLKGEFKKITLRIYEKEYPGLKEFIDKYSQSTNETQNNYLIKILDSYKDSIEFNDDSQKLLDTFIFFDKNIQKKIESYKEVLIKEDYLKRTSLRDLIHNIYPNKIERQNFYLKLIYTQFNSEFTLLNIISDVSNHFFQFLCEIENLPFNENEILKKYNNLIFNFQLNWFNELKFNRIISSREDFENINFNFNMLEKFLLKMYNGYQKQSSDKETREKLLLNKQKKKKTMRKGLRFHLKRLFREIVKDFNGLSDVILNFEKNESKLYHKIQYKPSEFFFKLIKIDEYADFIEKHNLNKPLADFIKKYLFFYYQINSIPALPSINLVVDMKIFFSRLADFEAFLKNLPDMIKNKQYNFVQNKEIVMKLKMILENYQIYATFIKEGIKVIPLEKTSIFTDLPENLLEAFNFIRDYLEKRGFDVESEFDKTKSKAEQTLQDRNLILHNLLKPEVKEKINLLSESFLKINKKN